MHILRWELSSIRVAVEGACLSRQRSIHILGPTESSQGGGFIACCRSRLHLRKGNWASWGLLSGEAPGARASSDVTGARDRSMDTEVEERRRMPRGGGRCEVRGSHSTKNAFTSGRTCGRAKPGLSARVA